MGHRRVLIADITSYLPEVFDTPFNYSNASLSNMMKNITTNIEKQEMLLTLIASSIYKPPDYLQINYCNAIHVHGLDDSSRIIDSFQIKA